MITGALALELLLNEKDINTVLDVGSGSGAHAAIMRRYGKIVHTISLAEPADIIGDFMDIKFSDAYDAIWAAHVLEHQLNINLFLRKCFRNLKDNGLFIVTVPPLKHEVVGGHINLYNPGILIYQCILAGFDCSNAFVIQYDYNISLAVRKKEAILPKLHMDIGDIELLAKFFPFEAKQGFNGNFKKAYDGILRYPKKRRSPS